MRLFFERSLGLPVQTSIPFVPGIVGASSTPHRVSHSSVRSRLAQNRPEGVNGNLAMLWQTGGRAHQAIAHLVSKIKTARNSLKKIVLTSYKLNTSCLEAEKQQIVAILA